MPQERIAMTMEGLLIGTDWHEVEKDGDTYYRWSGPGNESTIHLDIDRNSEKRLNLVIYKAISEDILHSLTLEADGIELQAFFSEARNPAHITAVLPKDLSKQNDQPTVLTLKLSKTIKGIDAFTGSSDKRSLGIALQALHLFPLTRPLFTSEKYSEPEPFDGIDLLQDNRGLADAIIQGRYKSAYDYYKQKGLKSYRPKLHAQFDERPGDLYDILSEEYRKERLEAENKLLEEITLLREIVYRQSDSIRELKAKFEQEDSLK